MKPPKTFEELEVGDKLYYYDSDDIKIFEQEVVKIDDSNKFKYIYFKEFMIKINSNDFDKTMSYYHYYFHTSFKECKKEILDYLRRCVKALMLAKKPYNAKETE
jgi:hypothetical protein